MIVEMGLCFIPELVASYFSLEGTRSLGLPKAAEYEGSMNALERSDSL